MQIQGNIFVTNAMHLGMGYETAPNVPSGFALVYFGV
jgi:hypothetical protein